MFPESLKTNKDIAPYYARYRELEEVNPIVSYYCKIRILDVILNKKLHVTDKEIETYVVELLNETELLKTQSDDLISNILNDKDLSISIVLSFTLKIYNQCLSDIQNYDGTNKGQLVSKFKACINFLDLISVFENDDINWDKLTNGKASTYQEFERLNKDRSKLIKYNLSKLLKDEIQIKGEQQELDALQEEIIDGKEQLTDSGESIVIDESEAPEDIDSGTLLPSAPTFIQDSPFIDDQVPDNQVHEDQVNLPGAPHFDPSDSTDLKLPGAPKFLPDDDLSKINKDSSITVIPPSKPSPATPAPTRDRKFQAPLPHVHHPSLTSENLEQILDKQETIAKIQKSCKFAISALNYEDITTAQAELTKSLELLQMIKNPDN